jgi:arsenite-transporting ATPase
MAIAEAARGIRTLVISTDPAPSLGHALRRRLTATPRLVSAGPRGATLHAAEVDAARAFDRWLAARRAALARITLRGTWLDQEDVTRLLRLSLPGIDEIAALLELSRFGRSGRYDLIVVDTAPTGHTLRMLAMPETVQAVAQLFDRMQAKHRVIVEALRGNWQPDEDDLVIEGMSQEAGDLADMVRDPSRATLSWVSLAEPMAVEETLDAVRSLAAHGIAVGEIILNRLTPAPPAACRWCTARRRLEARAIDTLRRRLGPGRATPALRAVLGRDVEPTGTRDLAAIGAALQKGAASFSRKDAAPSSGKPVNAVSDAPMGAGRAGVSSLLGEMPATLVMFGGKGGVGKTTCAAAAGVTAAIEYPGRRVLLVSTDPAHSLGDALGVKLGDVPRPLPGGPPNLQARELDAAAGFARVREKYRAAIDALFDRFTRGAPLDAAQDRRVMQDLIELAPPGIDELVAIIDVVDALEAKGAADLVILDTAPSGHALRLLDMPALVQEWTRALMSILLKYQPVVGIGELGPVLLRLSQGLGRLRARLADSGATHFIVVTRAAVLPRAESTRLLKRLARLHIHTPLVVVNAVGAGTCTRCRRQRAQERRELVRLRRDLASTPQRPEVAVTPARMPPPNGRDALAAWRHSWQVLR